MADELPPTEKARQENLLLGLLYDIRVAAGDPHGKLMQDELVERIRAKFAEPQAVRLSDQWLIDLWLYRKNLHNGFITPQLLDFARAIEAELSTTKGGE